MSEPEPTATTPYPRPPWHTHGRAFVQPFLVDARTLELPTGFEPIVVAGRSIGVLGYIEYLAPSPLVYAELVWMPCMIRITPSAGRVHRGYFVDKMYVDSDASLAAGRTEWALPKQKARFVATDMSSSTTRIAIETEDGAQLVLEAGARGPAVRSPVASSTLQDAGDHVVRFRGSGTAKLASGFVTIAESRNIDRWMGFATAKRLPLVGAALRELAITMHEPRHIDHVLH